MSRTEMPPPDEADERSDDATLVARIRVGDMRAVETVFRAHHATLLKFAYSRLGDRDVAEEVVEDVFASILLRRERLEVRGSLEAYLVGAVRNTILTRARSARREQARYERFAADEVPLMGVSPRAQGAGDEDDAQLQFERAISAAIAELPERQQTIVLLRWRHGANYESIAETMGMTVAAVKMQVSRTMQALRARAAELL